MSTAIPASADAPGLLAEPSPVRGSVADAESAARYSAESAQRATEAGLGLLAASRALQACTGAAIDAVRGRVATRLHPGAEELDASATDARRAFDAYAADIDRIHAEARRLRAGADGDLTAIRNAAGTLDDIARRIGASMPATWEETPPATLPDPGLGGACLDPAIADELRATHQFAWRTAATEWRDAADRLQRAREAWRRLIDERSAAERSLVGALRRTELGRIVEAGGTGTLPVAEMVAFAFSGELRGSPVPARPGRADVSALLDRTDLSGVAFSAAWRDLGLTDAEVAELPVETLAQLAHRPGLPARVQDRAATELLHFALADPQGAYALFAFGDDGPGLAEFRAQIGQLYDAWQDASFTARSLEGAPPVQLLAFGRHDDVVTAALAHGDLDAATHVSVNVSGMLSGMGSLHEDGLAARSLFAEASESNADQRYAAVAWIGYKSPGLHDVNFMGRAEAGGAELAAFVDGIHDSRDAAGAAIENFTVFGHSYGSTTAAVGLSDTRYTVDAFVAYGSAGLSEATPIDGINAEQVYATQARGDQVAWMGRLFSHSVDPIEAPGVRVFSSEGNAPGHLRVTAHDMFTEDDAPSLLNWGGKVGYLSSETESLERMASIWVGEESR